MDEETVGAGELIILGGNNCNGELNVRQVRTRKLEALGGLHLVFINRVGLVIVVSRVELGEGILL